MLVPSYCSSPSYGKTDGMGWETKNEENGARKTGRRRKETRQKNNSRGKQAEKREFENRQDMKTNGPVRCVEDLIL